MKILITLILLMITSAAFAEKRIALVIGNATYKTAPLKNPVNDASSISSALTQLGFEVTMKLNANKRTMKTEISKFGKALAQPNTVGLFYYAGHGIQVDNRNFLIPVNSTINGEADVEFEGIDAGRILGQMEKAGNNLNLVILDACRDNPFGGSFRSAKRGLARISAPKGSMIIYAASPGERADDGAGENGVFTENLLKTMKQPGLTVDQIFKKTASAVYNDTGESQLPYREGSILGDFYFKPGKQQVASISQTKPVLTSTGAEDTFIKYMDKEDLGQMKVYLDQYPSGKLSALFRFKLKNKEVLEYTLTVRSNVNGDKVTIDGKSYGPSRLDLKLKPGEHTIKIEKEGYEPFEKTIQLASNQTVRGILSEVPAPPQTNWESTPAVVQAQPKPKANTPKSRNWRDSATGMDFKWVPKGCFKMGSNESDDEKPIHQVCVNGYWMGKTEVTQGQWQKIMGNNPAYFKKKCTSSDCPVENVSWDDSQKFIQKLNRSTGQTFRLPTEAEWEYACRSGGKNEKYSGSNSIDNVAWYGEEWDSGTHQVAKKRPNGLGLDDMSGNVWEWVQDKYSKSAYGFHARNNPIYDAGGRYRVRRGGSFDNTASRSRCAFRGDDAPGGSFNYLGLRLARTP